MSKNDKENRIETASPKAGRVKAGALACFGAIAAVCAFLDLWSKSAIFAWLETQPAQRYDVINGLFALVKVENPGAAFGSAAGQRGLLISVSILAFIVVVSLVLLGHIRGRLMILTMGLFTGGIIGNLYDRAFNDGLVRDFLDFYVGDRHWPAFNLADSFLCIAVAILIGQSVIDWIVQIRAQRRK